MNELERLENEDYNKDFKGARLGCIFVLTCIVLVAVLLIILF